MQIRGKVAVAVAVAMLKNHYRCCTNVNYGGKRHYYGLYRKATLNKLIERSLKQLHTSPNQQMKYPYESELHRNIYSRNLWAVKYRDPIQQEYSAITYSDRYRLNNRGEHNNMNRVRSPNDRYVHPNFVNDYTVITDYKPNEGYPFYKSGGFVYRQPRFVLENTTPRYKCTKCLEKAPPTYK